MGAEREDLLKLSYITDTDVGYYKTGEIEGIFPEEFLENYIRRFGHGELINHISFLNYQVWQTVIKINGELNDFEDTKETCSNTGN